MVHMYGTLTYVLTLGVYRGFFLDLKSVSDFILIIESYDM